MVLLFEQVTSAFLNKNMSALGGGKDKGGERLLRRWFKMQERKAQLKVEKGISAEDGDRAWVALADHGVAH